MRGARCCGTRVRARAFDRASFDAHAGPLRCRCAVPRSSDGSPVAAHEESTAASAAGKRLSVWSAQSSCNCSDHQTFACLCMRGRGRKLVAIQTKACVCSWGGALACCSEPCCDLLTELLSPVGRKSLMLRMPDKVSDCSWALGLAVPSVRVRTAARHKGVSLTRAVLLHRSWRSPSQCTAGTRVPRSGLPRVFVCACEQGITAP